jgi:hypothetical protein
MYKTWAFSAQDGETVARNLEAHLNEHASEIISVSYAVAKKHHVLVVYRVIEVSDTVGAEYAVSAAEHIIDQAQL